MTDSSSSPANTVSASPEASTPNNSESGNSEPGTSASGNSASGNAKLMEKPSLSAMGSAYGYQKRDAEIVDYQIWKLWTPGAAFSVRGPRPAKMAAGNYCTSLGAAFTFGRFVAHPYAHLLGEALKIPSLNLAFSGVGPSFYNDPKNEPLIGLVNQSKFVTIAIFSGRSQSNSRFQATDYSQEQYRLEDGSVVPADFAYQQLLETADKKTIESLIAETRFAYIREFSKLLDRIHVPKVLIWFSKRSPDYEESYDSLFKLLSGFPHLVNRPMVDALKPLCDAYIEHVDSTGLPQPLISRFTQQPVSITRPRDYKKGKIQLKSSQLSENSYYASPQMHQSLAKKLVTVCQPWA